MTDGSGTDIDDGIFNTPSFTDGSGISPDEYATTVFGSTVPDTSESSSVSGTTEGLETNAPGVTDSSEKIIQKAF